MTWVNNLVPTPSGANQFRYEIYSNDPLDADTTRQLYYLELTATISTSDMDPPYSETQTVQLKVVNGCLIDQITNSGDYDGTYTFGNAGTTIPTNTHKIYNYYINERTQAPNNNGAYQ
jgi:hypothetical protein